MSKKIYTINGEHLPKELCKKFKEGWYKIGDNSVENSGDCYLIEDVFYRFETGGIEYDHSLKSYIRKNRYLFSGIVKFNEDGSCVFGKFSNAENMTKLIDNELRTIDVIDESIINTDIYIQSINDGRYYHKDIVELIPHINLHRFINSDFKRDFPYNSADYNDDYSSSFNPELFNPLPQIEEISELIKGYSFGVEFETSAGFIPLRNCKKLGLMPLRDGSIAGMEYATIPLEGAIGLQTLYESCKTLEKWTTYDDTCSIHIHIGGMPRTPKFITAFFKLSMMIQNEMFKLFPVYKQLNHGVKRKNYTAPYPIYNIMSRCNNTLKNDFNVLLNYLNDNAFSNENSFEQLYYSDIQNILHHPRDPENSAKWNIQNRYHFNNLIPILYTNKKTIEFRLHTPTFEFDKLAAFMLINIACIKFAERNQDSLIEGKLNLINISSIIEDSFSDKKSRNICGKLTDYYYNRVDKISSDFRASRIFVKESTIRPFMKIEESSDLSKDYIENSEFNWFDHPTPEEEETENHVLGSIGVDAINSVQQLSESQRQTLVNEFRNFSGTITSNPPSFRSTSQPITEIRVSQELINNDTTTF